MLQPQTLTDLLPQAAKALRPLAADRPSASDSTRINQAKRLFMQVADQICPGFQIRPEYRSVFHDITLWTLGVRGALALTKGLWLCGEVGTGKSTILQILAAYWPLVSGSKYHMRLTNVVDVCGLYQAEGVQALQTFVDWRLQGFDEVGREAIPTTHFGTALNVMEYILQRRYDRRSTHLTFVTTNMVPDQIAELYGEHIADRARQMFNLITLTGPSFRS